MHKKQVETRKSKKCPGLGSNALPDLSNWMKIEMVFPEEIAHDVERC